MLQHRSKYYSNEIQTLAMITALAIAPTILFAAFARANPAQGSAAAATATYQSKCAMCHGPDGAGSEVGKSLNVPDLRSPAVQKLPDAQLTQIITDGKGGMPSFKSSLSEDQIHALVTHIRSLRHAK